jgi:hypothetical protein
MVFFSPGGRHGVFEGIPAGRYCILKRLSSALGLSIVADFSLRLATHPLTATRYRTEFTQRQAPTGWRLSGRAEASNALFFATFA